MGPKNPSEGPPEQGLQGVEILPAYAAILITTTVRSSPTTRLGLAEITY
jgi:hypothetical protein